MSLTGSIAGVVSGLLSKSGGRTPDLSQLFATIRSAGENERNLIKELPESLRPLYEQYKASNAATADALKADTAAINDRLRKETEANYGEEVTRAALDKVKGEIYAELPGQQDAIRQALAATGGFDRGTAGKQLAAPVLQAASKYASAAADITLDQLKAKQSATQQAINSIANLDTQTMQSIFGMSKEQAMQILTSNRQDLKDQLTDLINQSRNETSQKLGVQGDQAMNTYRAQVAKDAKSDAMTNAWVNLGADAIGSVAGNPGFLAALNSPLQSAPANYNPGGSYAETVARLGY